MDDEVPASPAKVLASMRSGVGRSIEMMLNGWLRVGLVAATLAWPLAARAQSTLTVQGEWSLNQQLTPPRTSKEEDLRSPEGQFPQADRFGGLIGGRQGPDAMQRRRLAAVRRRLDEVPERLAIAIAGDRVQIIDEVGRVTTLIANGKKQDRVTGDGEFSSVTRLAEGRLIVDEEFGGIKVTTTYHRPPDDAQRLHVTLDITGLPRRSSGRGRDEIKAVLRVYDSNP